MSAYEALASHYDSLTDDVPYGRFADLYEGIFREYGVRPTLVLDLACGTGTLTWELARRGYELIGVDASADMLARAAEKAGERAVPVMPIFLNQTMEELDLFGTVSAAVCSLDGVNYLPPERLGTVFERLRLFVEPGGLFIFDVNTPERLRGLDGQVFLDERPEVYCVWRGELTEDGGALRYGMDLFSRRADGLWERSFEEHTEYLHPRERLVSELERHGFGQIRFFDGPGGEAPGERRAFVAARRM